MSSQTFAGFAAVFLVIPAGGQAPTSPRHVRSSPPAIHVVVRDLSGSPLDGVKLVISGEESSEAITDTRGTATVVLANGSYRFRFEHDGFIALERDVTIKAGQPGEIDIALNRAPAPPEPEPPQPLTEPVAAAPRPPPSPAASGPPVNVSIPRFLESNFIGRDPLKESILSCTSDATTRLLQLRESVVEHAHAASDEVLYVVAGEGAVRIGDETTPVAPGSVSVIPRGTPHALERRGKSPLIMLSTLAGQSCSTPSGGHDR